MNNRKLVLFEGIPGSGKTTMAGMLHDYRVQNRVKSRLYLEGCEHPIDLTFYAYLTPDEYRALLVNYPDQAAWFSSHAISETDYMLVPYKTPATDPYDEAAFSYLKVNEFCYASTPVVPFSAFKKVFLQRFEKFVAAALADDSFTILESTLFQHQIHDINRLYPDVTDHEIIATICSLASVLRPLQPVLFYLSQDDVRNHLNRTAEIRSKPKWSSEAMVAYYEKRLSLELKIIETLPIESLVIDNTAFNLDDIFHTVKQSLQYN